MHSMTVVFGPAGTILQFLFKERASAEKMLLASRQGADDIVVVKDDFNQHAEIRRASIHGISVEDLAESGNAVIERSIQHAKTQVKGNNRAAQEPALKFAMPGNGMALNHPGTPRRPI